MDPLAAMEAAGRGQVCGAETVEASTGNNVAAGRMEDERAGGRTGGTFSSAGIKGPKVTWALPVAPIRGWFEHRTRAPSTNPS